MAAKRSTALLAAAALLAGSGAGQAASGIQARIDVREGGTLELVGIIERATGSAGDALSFRFEVRRSGAGGRSQSVQSGRAAVAAGDALVVGRAALGGADAATVEARLEVRDGATVVATAALRLPPAARDAGDGP
jgi:hypothetical protein